MTMLPVLLAISMLMLATGATAQPVDEHGLEESDAPAPAKPAIAEPAGAAELRAAMRRISLSPNDADALADAGSAALILGDANAGLNFYTRANALRPNNGRIVAGLAAATVWAENPFEALRLFDDAVRLGINERSIAADRALAFDLLGNFARAQQDYRLARTVSNSDDLIVRHAISISLAGQKAEADAMLVPLLQKNNAAAWRARAFLLAARGDFRESAQVTQGFMDAESAQRMERYLRLMPSLTGAQQAAAIHLGHFPASQYVGRDSDQVRKVASTIPPVQSQPNDNRLIPAGDPFGIKPAKPVTAEKPKPVDNRRDRKARDDEQVKAIVANIPEAIKLPKTDTSRLGTETARAKIAEVSTSKITSVTSTALPPPETARPLQKVELPVQNSGTEVKVPPPPASVEVRPSPEPLVPAAQPIVREPNRATVQNQPQFPQPVSPSPAAAAFDLAAIVGAIEIPESEQKPSAVAVDLKKIKPAAPKIAVAEDPAKMPKTDPKNAPKVKAVAPSPARFWVQIATGEAGALAVDYRKFVKKNPDLYKSTSGWTSSWGKTSRLLVGPFVDQKLAKKWEADYKKAGGDGFMWKSENGVVVTALKGK
ncbi:hypothetical protein EUU23_06360 [Sphingorhabdus sp. IMCC26285]|uniref:Uncharacterized protein n=1 Tax=Sphingorhabdus profundilacus TaxID=2509718 RepID=A0A6I4LZ29_9SPHN|nr:hypothetical protein [Sphingorhabdus profundilacus]MVZ97326.1 hypothetical protein [Sphingorhabdus profundilacus]